MLHTSNRGHEFPTGNRDCRLFDSLIVEVILLALGEHQDNFVRPRTAVLNALWHAVGLMPDDDVSDYPSIILGGYSNTLRNQAEILCWNLCVCSSSLCTTVFLGSIISAIPFTGT